MWKGSVVSIYKTPSGGQPMHAVDEVRAVPGKGLEGDRYYNRTGNYSNKPGPEREITLIEIEAIEALQHEVGIALMPAETRRNLVTRGVPLNHLVDQEFRVGEVTLRGVRLCEPCQYLASLTQPGVLPALIHRGGLRAQIISEGMIHIGDAITENDYNVR
jgi:MOSC domain-containing protein YiiM